MNAIHYIRTVWLGIMTVFLLTISAPAAEPVGSVTFVAGGATVDGDQGLYREHHWRNDAFSAGIQDLHLEMGPLTIDGNGIFDENNYDLDLTYQLPGNFFIHTGFKNQRKYYDDTGGYLADGSSFSLDQELELDSGGFEFEIGRRGENLPEFVLGYEHHYKDGTKSTLEYGRVGDGVYPANKTINEALHVIRLDAKHRFKDFVIRDHARYETYDLNTQRIDRVPTTVSGGTYDSGHVVDEDADYHLLSNAISVEKWITDSTFFGIGYLYQDLAGSNDFAMDQLPGRQFWTDGGLPVADSALNRAKFFRSQSIDVDRDTHIFNLSGMTEPKKDFVVAADFSGQYSRTETAARLSLLEGASIGGGNYDIINEEVDADSDVDQIRYEEGIELRYTGFSAFHLYANGRFVQDHFDHYEREYDIGTASQLTLRDTDVDVDDRRYRIGTATTVIPGFLVNAYYQRRNVDQEFDHKIDEEAAGDAGTGYSAHILALDTKSDELALRISCAPRSWLRTAFQYQFIATDVVNDTRPIPNADPDRDKPGGTAEVMDYRSDVFSIKIDFVPNDRIYWSNTIAYTIARTEIPSLSDPTLIDDYEGDYVTVLSSARYVFSNNATSATIGISWTYVDNKQTNTVGQPLAADYDWRMVRVGLDHQLSDTVSTRLEYAYTHFEDANYYDAADYSAHAILFSLTKAF